MPMTIFNIYSISNYILSIYFYLKDKTNIVFFLVYSEIFLHQVAGSYFIGYGAGFSTVLMCLFLLQFTYFRTWLVRCFISLFLLLSIYSLYYFKDYLSGEFIHKKDLFFYINVFSSSMFMLIYGALASVSSNKKLADLTYLVYRDFLTSLFNRKYFEEKIIPTINKDEPVLFAICDIDNFKSINDTYGHDIGDIVLQSVASTIHYEILGYKGIVARWGGEEFLIKVNLQTEQEAKCCMDIIKNSVERLVLQKYNIDPTITIGGIFVQNPKKENFETYFKIADQELYFGKKTGKNSVNLKIS